MVSKQSYFFFKFGLILFLAGINTQCGQFKLSDATIRGINKRISPDYNGPAEPTYCGGATSYVNPHTITGSAKYEYRKIEYSSTLKGLGEVSETLNPIRYAEYVVLNNIGQMIQCGETDANGDFSFVVPSNNQIYRLQIRSRADNDFYKASVLRSPESNELYRLEASFAATSNQTLDLVAKATGDLLGGAFHILDQILTYNEKLRTAEFAGTCSGFATGCTPFTVAPKAQVYWEKGFNPGSYFSTQQISSFYYKGLSRLFILGGVNGDVNYSDTDHFDKSIIAHEYFHFLEDVYSQSDSPGGQHNGNQILDPRLAWSEGVAQFFQSAMTGISRVLDTVGNVDGATQLVVNYSIEDMENDVPQYAGEGEFREFSVARMLWDMFDEENESPNPNFCENLVINSEAYRLSHDKCPKGNFTEFWATLTGNGGFNDSTLRFISAGAFHERYLTNINTSNREQNLQPLAIFEKQAQHRNRYGRRLTTSGCGTATTFTMSSPFNTSTTGQLIDSHPVTNNRYFYIQHSGGALVIQSVASLNNSPGFSAHVDTYLFPENYIWGETTPLASNTANNSLTPTTNVTKNMTVANLAAGFYLIVFNVKSTNSATGNIQITFSAGATVGSLGNLCSAM